MRYAESHRIKGSILIAPSYTDLGDELEKQSGYFVSPWNWKAIKDNQDRIAIFHSDNDPYIPQDDFEFIAKQLKAEVVKIPGQGHFTDEQTFPRLLECIKKHYK